LFGSYPRPTPPAVHEFYSDFDTYLASQWIVTTATGTSALAAGNGGFLLQTTSAGATDIQANELSVKSFNLITGARAWFAINVNLDSATLSLFQAGWANTFATMAPTDGIYFEKPSGAAVLNLILNKGGTKTTLLVGTVAAATAYTLGWYYDGSATPTLYAYATIGLTIPTSQGQPYWAGGNQRIISASADGSNANPLTNLPLAATGLTAGFGIKNSTAVARTNTVDYFLTANEIVRF
jgi:hypothetical protein